MKNDLAPGFLLTLGFAAFLLVPSFDTILKYFGPVAIPIYFGTGVLAAFFALRYLVPAFMANVNERAASAISVVLLIALVVFVFYVYPIANSGRLGPGSDADEAMIVAVKEVLNGNYPYYQRTYLGNPISPLPGTIIFAAPFVMIGIYPLQNVLWLAALFLAVRTYLRSNTQTLPLFLMIILFSPTVLQNLATGGDYMSNAIYVLLVMWLMSIAIPDEDSPLWKKAVPSILFGLALSSRSNFGLLVPVLFSYLVQRAGWRPAILYTAISAVTALAITLPFWLYDPAAFSPFTVQTDKLRQLNRVLPFAEIIIPSASGLFALIVSLRTPVSLSAFFLNCAIVQLFALLVPSLLHSANAGELTLYLGQSGYGMFTLFFGVLAFWLKFADNKYHLAGA